VGSDKFKALHLQISVDLEAVIAHAALLGNIRVGRIPWEIRDFGKRWPIGLHKVVLVGVRAKHCVIAW
jgi:hypothetical protein